MQVLARMEQAGVKIDRKVLEEMSSRLEREVEAKANEIYEQAGSRFNVNSPKQLGDVLFNQMNLPKPVKYGKGKTISTAVDVLEQLALTHDIARLVLEYRQLSKLKSTYVDALPALLNPATGRLHTTFGQTGTATGRLSSTNPNLQNIPIRTELGREIRAAFTVEPGHVLLAADYSQIELRLLAHFSQDPLLVEAYRRGDDIHTLTASQVFGVPPLMVTADHRRQAKVVNFGIVYGLSPFGLSQTLGIEPREAKQFIDAYFEKYKGVRAFIDKTLEGARREQKVTTLFGRVRPIPDINSKNINQRGFAERTAVNTPLQGTAADLIKIAMIRIDAALRERGLKSRMTLQVHDELVFEVPEQEIDDHANPGARSDGKCPSADGAAAGRSRSRTELARPGVASHTPGTGRVGTGLRPVQVERSSTSLFLLLSGPLKEIAEFPLINSRRHQKPAELRSAWTGRRPVPTQPGMAASSTLPAPS